MVAWYPCLLRASQIQPDPAEPALPLTVWITANFTFPNLSSSTQGSFTTTAPRSLAFWVEADRPLSCCTSPEMWGDFSRPFPTSPHHFGVLQEEAEGLLTWTMKSQSSTSKAMSFTPSPCFTRCSPISVQGKNSHGHEQSFAPPGPFPTPSLTTAPTLISWVESR